jgi:TP901 family phage tail tape measure protein
MAVVGELLVILAGSNAALTATLAKSEAELKAFAATAQTQTSIARSAMLGVGVGGAVIAAGAALIGGASIKAAADFQESMAIINTIAQQTPEELDKTGNAIRRLAIETGTGLPEMTSAFYDLLSAGIATSDAMTVLKLSTTLSIGGLATVGETVDLLTGAINGYGLSMAGAAVITDQFALAVQDGKVHADEISATFSTVAPLAHATGIGIDEIAATYAVLTSQNVHANEAMTQMQRAILELLKPSAGLIALQKETGINFAKLAADKGLVNALETMRIAADKAGIPFDSLFGRVEGLNFALETTGPNFKKYNDELLKMQSLTPSTGAGGIARQSAELGGPVGPALTQAQERMGTFDRQMKILGVTINDIGITIGTALLPVLNRVADFILPIVNHIAKWIAANPELSAKILLVAGGIGVLAVALALLSPIIGVVVLGLGLISMPVIGIVSAIALLALAWANNWLGIRDIVTTVAGVIGTAIQGILDIVNTVAKAIGEFFGWLTHKTTGAEAELAGLKPGTVVTRPGAVRPATPYVSPYTTPTGGTPTPGLFAGSTTTTVGGVPVSGMFQHGGVVPGFGAQLVIAHGGETIIPPGAGAAGGINSVRHIHIEVGGRELMEYIDREMFGSASGFSSGFTSNSPVTGA